MCWHLSRNLLRNLALSVQCEQSLFQNLLINFYQLSLKWLTRRSIRVHFPTFWKEALVDPNKKVGINNLRPISNLQYVSKLTERPVFYQVHAHLTSHDFCPRLQSAYRKGHSSKTALLKNTQCHPNRYGSPTRGTTGAIRPHALPLSKYCVALVYVIFNGPIPARLTRWKSFWKISVNTGRS